MIWDNLIQSWGQDPAEMAEEDKILLIATVADMIEETRESQLLLYMIRSEHMRANGVFNEARVDPAVLMEHAAVARCLNGILSALREVKENRDLVRNGPDAAAVEEQGEPYTSPTTGYKGDV